MPAGIFYGLDSGAVVSSTIAKGANRAAAQKLSKKEPIRKKKESYSDDEIMNYGEGGAMVMTHAA